jgi:opacity protein-like surface antigen
VSFKVLLDTMSFLRKFSKTTTSTILTAIGLTALGTQTDRAEAGPSESRSDLNLSFSKSPLSLAAPTDPTAPATPTDPTAPATPPAPDAQSSVTTPAANNWYGGLGIGLNGPTLSRNGVFVNGGGAGNLSSDVKLDVDSGVGFNGFVGYKFSGFRVEGEAAYASNSYSGITARTPVGTNIETARLFGTTGSIGTISNFAVMVNGYYDVPTGTAITPFIGGGIGYGTTNVSGITNISIFGQNITPVPSGGSNSGIAYQVKAGANYALSANNDVYVQYRYFTGSGDSTYSTNNLELGTKLSF